jgi:hypothetical protein
MRVLKIAFRGFAEKEIPMANLNKSKNYIRDMSIDELEGHIAQSMTGETRCHALCSRLIEVDERLQEPDLSEQERRRLNNEFLAIRRERQRLHCTDVCEFA